VIDIGRALHIALKTRELLLSYYFSLVSDQTTLEEIQFNLKKFTTGVDEKLLNLLCKSMFSNAVSHQSNLNARNLFSEINSFGNGFLFDIIAN
jgi:hypothetical protein